MQSIERYGVVALLFLVVTVVVVLVWEGDDGQPALGDVAQASAPAQAIPTPAPTRIKMTAPPVRRPLRRTAATDTPSAGGGIVPGRASNVGVADVKPSGRAASLSAHLAERQAAKKANAKREATRRQAARDRLDRLAADAERAKTKPQSYTVVAGDTLGAITSKQLGSVKRMGEILALNPKLNPDRLKVGQAILLPRGDAPAGLVAATRPVPSKAESKDKPAESPAGSGYVVQRGDSMWRIAQRTLGDGERWREIAKLNPKINANALHVGQKLSLPSGAGQPVAARAASIASVTTPGASRKGRVR